MELRYYNSNTAFGTVKTAPILKEKIKNSNCQKKFINQFVAIRHRLSREGMCKTKNIDLLLDYSLSDGFNATVVTKNGKYITPENGGYYKNIVLNNDKFRDLKKWVNEWDNIFG